MYKLIGRKEVFAIEMDITNDKWVNKTALWLNNIRIGDWEDENLLAPFINSMYRITKKYDELWLSELEGLNCYDIYLRINPCYNDPDSFYDLLSEEQESLIRFDKFIFDWGENFNSWGVRTVCKEGILKFMWVHTTSVNGGSYEERNNIKCFDVDLKMVNEIYKEMAKFIPSEFWPSLIPR